MSGLVWTHELWIHAPYLVPRIAYTSGWIPEPRWSTEGRPLLSAALEGQDALERVWSRLVSLVPFQTRLASDLVGTSLNAGAKRSGWPSTGAGVRERGPSLSPMKAGGRLLVGNPEVSSDVAR